MNAIKSMWFLHVSPIALSTNRNERKSFRGYEIELERTEAALKEKIERFDAMTNKESVEGRDLSWIIADLKSDVAYYKRQIERRGPQTEPRVLPTCVIRNAETGDRIACFGASWNATSELRYTPENPLDGGTEVFVQTVGAIQVRTSSGGPLVALTGDVWKELDELTKKHEAEGIFICGEREKISLTDGGERHNGTGHY
jgi:hypothetical protein